MPTHFDPHLGYDLRPQTSSRLWSLAGLVTTSPCFFGGTAAVVSLPCSPVPASQAKLPGRKSSSGHAHSRALCTTHLDCPWSVIVHRETHVARAWHGPTHDGASPPFSRNENRGFNLAPSVRSISFICLMARLCVVHARLSRRAIAPSDRSGAQGGPAANLATGPLFLPPPVRRIFGEPRAPGWRCASDSYVVCS